MIDTKEKISSGINSKKAFLFILSYVRKHIKGIILGIILLILVDFIQIIIPGIVQRTIDLLGEEYFSQELVLKYTLYILLLAFSMIIIRFFWRLCIMGSARKIEKEIREDMFKHLLSLSFSFFNRKKTGDLMALMINDVKAIRMAAGPSFIALTDVFFMGSMALAFMFSISVRLTLITIIPLPIIIIMMAKFGPMVQKRFKAVQESFAMISSYAQESLSGIRVIKSFNQEEGEINSFEKRCDDYVDKNLKLINIWGFFFPSITLLANLSVALLYLIGGKFVILEDITFGQFVSFAMYINILVWPIIAVGWVFNILQRGIASSKRILDLLGNSPDVFDSKDVNINIKKIRGEIEIKNLNFRYSENSRYVLRNINLKIPAGSSLGIMGKPGSGKSTLISLLLRLFPIPGNQIFIDGYDINDIPLKVLRSAIGYIPQDSFLFSDTIKNNLTFGLGEEERSFNKIERFSKVTALNDDIIRFKEKYYTKVGERGVSLSGGQKQRLSIARALIINPDVLIFDDALSAVDAATERIILENISPEIKKRTYIAIAQRVSTVRECDKIIVIEDGKIIESGTHQELVKIDSYYGKLFRLQRIEEEVLAN